MTIPYLALVIITIVSVMLTLYHEYRWQKATSHILREVQAALVESRAILAEIDKLRSAL